MYIQINDNQERLRIVRLLNRKSKPIIKIIILVVKSFYLVILYIFLF